jgi:hypothetical protein
MHDRILDLRRGTVVRRLNTSSVSFFSLFRHSSSALKCSEFLNRAAIVLFVIGEMEL